LNPEKRNPMHIALKNQHKNKMDYVILDSRKRDFLIWISLIRPQRIRVQLDYDRGRCPSTTLKT